LEIHQKIHSGEDLGYQDFNTLWRKHQLLMFGDKVEFDTTPQEAIGWSSIPHIFNTPFYVYSYAFGNLLTFALYQKYQQEGQSFVQKYKDILSSGGSKEPYQLLIENGLDIT
ncbi:MAG: M3 family metallopeptidase, partial [Dolichospermum sp.]